MSALAKTEQIKVEGFKVSEVPYLCHYQAGNLEWIENLLTKGQVRFSQPGYLNDPWDCRPWYDISCIDNEQDHQEHVDGWVTSAQKQGKSAEEISAIEHEFRNNKEKVKSGIKGLSKEMFAAIRQQYRIFCLTPKSDCQLLWGHYAAAHTGVCLEFKTKNEMFCSALKVQYCKGYPKMKFVTDEVDGIIPLLVKSDAWSYENEYRLVAEEEEYAKGKETLKTKDGFLQVPEDSLNAILVGVNMPLDQVNAILKLVNEKKKSVQVRQAAISPDRYEFTFKTL